MPLHRHTTHRRVIEAGQGVIPGVRTNLKVGLGPAVVCLLESAVRLLVPQPCTNENCGVRDLLRYMPCGTAGWRRKLGGELVGAVLALLHSHGTLSDVKHSHSMSQNGSSMLQPATQTSCKRLRVTLETHFLLLMHVCYNLSLLHAVRGQQYPSQKTPMVRYVKPHQQAPSLLVQSDAYSCQ